jgi:hypothetical protein
MPSQAFTSYSLHCVTVYCRTCLMKTALPQNCHYYSLADQLNNSLHSNEKFGSTSGACLCTPPVLWCLVCCLMMQLSHCANLCLCLRSGLLYVPSLSWSEHFAVGCVVWQNSLYFSVEYTLLVLCDSHKLHSQSYESTNICSHKLCVWECCRLLIMVDRL